MSVGLLDRLACSNAGHLELGTKPADLDLERNHAPHAFQVQPGSGELLDPPQVRDVSLAVTPIAPSGPGRVQESLSLVYAKRLRVDAGQLGGNGDHVDGARRAFA
jgi:hypothetical protein